MSLIISAWIKNSAQALSATSDSARLDAEVLLAWMLNKDRTYLYTWPERALSPSQETQLSDLLARRINGEPIAYIVGEKEFWSLPFYTNASTLIPRPDTEVLVERVLARLPESPQAILDLGTGTGAIAISIAHERPDCQVDAVDRVTEAVALTKSNCLRNQVKNVSAFQSDWFSKIEKRYDIIISNPPYIDASDEHLTQGDVAFEPRSALVADDEGLADIHHIVYGAKLHLSENGFVVIEHGYQQKEGVQSIFKAAGYSNIVTEKDYGGNDRVTFGVLKVEPGE